MDSGDFELGFTQREREHPFTDGMSHPNGITDRHAEIRSGLGGDRHRTGVRRSAVPERWPEEAPVEVDEFDDGGDVHSSVEESPADS